MSTPDTDSSESESDEWSDGGPTTESEWDHNLGWTPCAFDSIGALLAAVEGQRYGRGQDALVPVLVKDETIMVYVCLQKAVGPIPDPRQPNTSPHSKSTPLNVQKVMVPAAHRRRGVCTEIFRSLVQLAPRPVRVQSVISPQMEKLLQKVGAVKEPYGGSTWWLAPIV